MTSTNPVVLQNKGVPIKLYVAEAYVRTTSKASVNEKGELVHEAAHSVAWRPAADENDNPIVVREWLKLDANVLAQIEHRYDGMVGFQEASQRNTNEVIRVVVTLVLGLDPDDPDHLAQVGARMIPAESGSYQNAIMASLSMASGVDPTNAARLLDEGALAVKKEVAAANEELVKALDEAQAEREAEELAAKAETTGPDEQPDPTATGTPGTDGSASGSGSDEPTTSSGD